MKAVNETNPIPEGYHKQVTHKIKRAVPWSTPGLRITRLRLLSDPGFAFWDVSYCHGELDGEPVKVTLPFSQLRKGKAIQTQLVDWAKREGLFLKPTGIFDNISALN